MLQARNYRVEMSESGGGRAEPSCVEDVDCEGRILWADENYLCIDKPGKRNALVYWGGLLVLLVSFHSYPAYSGRANGWRFPRDRREASAALGTWPRQVCASTGLCNLRSGLLYIFVPFLIILLFIHQTLLWFVRAA